MDTSQDSDDIHDDVVGITVDSRFYLNCEYNYL